MRKTLTTAATMAIIGLAPMAPAFAGTADDSIQLSWDGTNYSNTATSSFIGIDGECPTKEEPKTTGVWCNRIVPGDHESRTLTIRNDGPGPGTLKGWIINVTTTDPGAKDGDTSTVSGSKDSEQAKGSPNRDFYSDLQGTWSGGLGSGHQSFKELASRDQTKIGEVHLAQGQTVTLNVGYDFPESATSGNGANVAPRVAKFNVLLEIQGDTSPTPRPTPTTPTSLPTQENPVVKERQQHCKDVGKTNILLGEPLYSESMDSDHDGIACEQDNRDETGQDNRDETGQIDSGHVGGYTRNWVGAGIGASVILLGGGTIYAFARKKNDTDASQ